MDDETPAEQTTPPASNPPEAIEIDIRKSIRRAFPWLQLTRALGLSFDLNKLALAVAGVLLLQLIGTTLDASLLHADAPRQVPLIDWYPASWLSRPLERLTEPARVLVGPLFSCVSMRPFDRTVIHGALTCFATIAVWGLIGGALARIALVQLGWGQALGSKRSLEYAVSRIRPLIVTPLLPIVVLSLSALFCAIFGLIFKLPGIGGFLGGLFLFIPISFGLLMFVLLAGLAAGWPLMVASVAAEGEDELDSLSRSFSYLNHRLGRYLFYLLVAFLIGIPGVWVVDLFADGTLRMTQWALGMTVPREALDAAFSLANRDMMSGVASPTNASRAWSLPAFWIGFVRLLTRSWAYSYFWTSISLIYLLIRKDVDGAEWSQLKPEGFDEA